MRLLNGTTALEGRVEVCWGAMWTPICTTSWNSLGAKVVCRQLGYSTAGMSCSRDYTEGNYLLSNGICLDNPMRVELHALTCACRQHIYIINLWTEYWTFIEIQWVYWSRAKTGRLSGVDVQQVLQ